MSRGTVFDIDTFATHDGPGIRMAVYLKGCPLRCAWCHSPESQSPRAELVFVEERCTLCGACEEACPEGVHRIDPAGHYLDRSGCTACGACVEACPAAALELKGTRTAVDEIVGRARRMRPFFVGSGGGVTLSGGEVTMQSEFALAILSGLRSAGIHTLVETAGFCPAEVLDSIAAAADTVYYDLKLIDDEEHRRWTGVSNELILRNLSRLDARKTVVRVPLVPGITDTNRNIEAICRTVEAAGLRHIEYLPFNASAGAKYEWLGRSIAVDGVPQSRERIVEILKLSAQTAPSLTVGAGS